MNLRLLRGEDLPDLMRLKEAAGWNQTEADWLRLLYLQPEGCFGIENHGNVVACASVVKYPPNLSWVGMVLTLPDYRGRGLARKLMDSCLEFAQGTVVRLDASSMGQPLYESLGFVEECTIERWSGTAQDDGKIVDMHGQIDLELDRSCYGADRSALLTSLAKCKTFVSGDGFALARPGSLATFFGPCLSRSFEGASTVLRAFLSSHAGEPVYWDLFPHHAQVVELARGCGFSPLRHLSRMVLNGTPRRPDPRIYAAAGFEWG